uniref:hypothetical protein n=1 Tax=uncultured Sphingomonas sp. TaxID=158754 RepID=UPI0035CAFFD7
MTHRPRNRAATTTLTATRATAFTGRKWVRWTVRMKAEFLDSLAATCSVVDAAAAIGVGPVSVYALRRRDPAFLADWEQALMQGYQVLETRLLGHLLAGRGRTDPVARPEDGQGGGAVDVETILRVLAHHRAKLGAEDGGAAGRARGGRGARGGPAPRRASDADTEAAILKKLAAIEKRRGA